MKSLTHQQTRAQGLTTTSETIAQKIERTRAEVRRAITDVQAVEGRFLDYETAEAIQRALVAANRNLQELNFASYSHGAAEN